MTTRTQIAEWEKSAAIAWHTDDNISNFDVVERGYIQGYIRARTEQATEIAELERLVEHYRNVFYTAYEENTELKAKLAKVMPLAKFGAMTMKTESCLAFHRTGLLMNALKCGVLIDTEDIFNTVVYAPNIEATIKKLLKD
jgi:hypothetical protein